MSLERRMKWTHKVFAKDLPRRNVENFTLRMASMRSFRNRNGPSKRFISFVSGRKLGIDDPKELLVAGQFNKMKIDQIWGSWSFKLYEPHFHRVKIDEEKIIGGYILDCLRKFHQKKIGET